MTAAPHPPDRWPRRAAAMAVLALAAAALAWFLGPAPLVGNAPQTELLSIQGLGAGGERLCWRPPSVVERQAARALVDRMAESAVDPAGQTIFISHGDCEADAEFVADEVRRRFGVQDIYINYVGPVIGNHSGPGTLALFFLGSHR